MAVTEALPSKPETPIEKTETFAEKTEILSEKTPTFTGKMVVDEVSGWLQIFDDGSVDRTWTGHSAVLPLISEIPPSPPCTFEIFTGKYNARLYLPKKFPGGEITKVPLLLHFHGGGFCISQPDWYMYTQFYSRLCDAAGAAILSVRMRRAPEHRLPAAIEDCCEALRWLGRVADGFEAEPLLHGNVDFNRIFFIGDSSGGNLVHWVAACAFKENLVSPNMRIAGCIPIHPGFVRSTRSDSELNLESDSSFLTLDMVDKFLALAVPRGATKDHPYTCPMGEAGMAEIEGLELPDFLVPIAERDLIRDTELEYCDSMRRKGYKVEVLMSKGMGHCFYMNKVAIDSDPYTKEETDKLIEVIVDFVHRH